MPYDGQAPSDELFAHPAAAVELRQVEDLASAYASLCANHPTDKGGIDKAWRALRDAIRKLQSPASPRDAEGLQRDYARSLDTINGQIVQIGMLEERLRELRAFQAMVNRYAPEFPVDPDAPRDVWYWQGDGRDHLESMVHQLPVVIRAEQLRDLLAASPSSAAAISRWQPICEAPKDGTEVWAFNGEQGRMRWIEGDGYALWAWADTLLSDTDPMPTQPTHFMPLPADPASPLRAQPLGDANG